MASKPSHDTLIHCEACGEDYSATYRRCPFCGERNDPRRAAAHDDPPRSAPARGRDEEELDDGYVFDGQDAFNDETEEEQYTPRPKGGKRLAPKEGGRGMDLPPINWPRLITFLCSLVIIAAALIIVFTFIYPQLHKNPDPKTEESQQVPPPASVAPIGEPTAGVGPVDPVGQETQPVEPPQPVSVDPTGITLDIGDFTLWVGESHQMVATVAPEGWSGEITWSSSDSEHLTVSSTGLVTNVNASGTFHNVYVTATAGNVSAQCVVRVKATKKDGTSVVATDPPAAVTTDPPVAVTTEPPAPASQAPSSGGVTVGADGIIVGADGGLRVRSGPGTTYEIVASLLNGNAVHVVAESENGWYQISFNGSSGATMYGYIMGDYISTN